MPDDRDEERESDLLSTEVDPLVRAVLEAVDPWDAYKAANDIPGSFADALDWMPHGGALYTAWAELTDLFEIGKTPVPDAHAALRQAATDWFAESGALTNLTLEAWLLRTQTSIEALVARDGDFWQNPEA